jgi:hypothetical protein
LFIERYNSHPAAFKQRLTMLLQCMPVRVSLSKRTMAGCAVELTASAPSTAGEATTTVCGACAPLRSAPAVKARGALRRFTFYLSPDGQLGRSRLVSKHASRFDFGVGVSFALINRAKRFSATRIVPVINFDPWGRDDVCAQATRGWIGTRRIA